MGISPASALARSNLKTTGTPSSRSEFDSEIGAERCAGSWHQQAGQLPQLASFFCHTPIRERTGHSHNSGIDGAQGPKNNNDLYACSQSRTIGRRQPGRFPVKKRKRAAVIPGPYKILTSPPYNPPDPLHHMPFRASWRPPIGCIGRQRHPPQSGYRTRPYSVGQLFPKPIDRRAKAIAKGIPECAIS